MSKVFRSLQTPITSSWTMYGFTWFFPGSMTSPYITWYGYPYTMEWNKSYGVVFNSNYPIQFNIAQFDLRFQGTSYYPENGWSTFMSPDPYIAKIQVWYENNLLIKEVAYQFQHDYYFGAVLTMNLTNYLSSLNNPVLDFDRIIKVKVSLNTTLDGKVQFIYPYPPYYPNYYDYYAPKQNIMFLQHLFGKK